MLLFKSWLIGKGSLLICSRQDGLIMTLRLNLGLRVRSAQDQRFDRKRDHTLCYKTWGHSPYKYNDIFVKKNQICKSHYY